MPIARSYDIFSMVNDKTDSFMAIDRNDYRRFLNIICGYGGEGVGVSMAAAARHTGISKSNFLKMVERSREKREEDDDWVHEISVIYDSHEGLLADTLKDAAFDRALNGIESDVYHNGEVVGKKINHDNKMLMSLLGAHNDRYTPKNKVETTNNDMKSVSEIFESIKHIVQHAKAKEAEGKNILEAKEVKEIVIENE